MRPGDDPRRELAKVVGLITGPTSIRQVARLLGAPPARLAAFLRGDAYISRSTVLRQGWADRLRDGFPEAWAVHADAFERALGVQRQHAGAPSRTPPRECAFAVALGRLVGHRPRCDVAAALGISSSHLSRILRGQAMVSRERASDWLALLRLLLPGQWTLYGPALAAAAHSLPERSSGARRASGFAR